METSTLLNSLESPTRVEPKNRFLRSHIGSKRTRNRLVQKHGLCNISLVNVPKQHRKYFRDIFTTVIEVKWRWCLLFFSMSFFLSWSLFTGIYYLLAMYHGDLHRSPDDEDWTPCIRNGHDALNIFLFAFTTQTTIGYGFRYPTDRCPLVVIVMCVQFMVGVMCQTLMAGVIFAKLARPIKRAATILFSKNAVICMRDGKLCLQFRVGDMRKSLLAEAHVRLQLIKKCVTMEGEILPFHQFDMNVGYDTGLDRVFVIWPITICHEINEESPLYEISKEGLSTERFEIIVILEGVVESVGSTTQARTSYLPNEILWGKRFARLVTYQRDNGQYKIDLAKFHDVRDVETPSCSAKELDDMESLSDIHPDLGPQISVSAVSIQESLNEANNRIVIESDSNESENENLIARQPSSLGISMNSNHRSVSHQSLFLRKKSVFTVPSEADMRRKQSIQVRRGPDLF